jgi:hypothetical protein
MGHPQLGGAKNSWVGPRNLAWRGLLAQPEDWLCSSFRQLEELYRTGDRKWNRLVQETHRTVKTQSDVIRQDSTTGFAL